MHANGSLGGYEEVVLVLFAPDTDRVVVMEVNHPVQLQVPTENGGLYHRIPMGRCKTTKILVRIAKCGRIDIRRTSIVEETGEARTRRSSYMGHYLIEWATEEEPQSSDVDSR